MPTSTSLKHVYAFVGAERFLRTEAIAVLLERFAPQLDEVGPTRFDGQEASLAEVLDDVRTISLLGGIRVAIVDEADSFITAGRTALEKYCGTPADTGCLILSCKSLPKNTRLYKVIAQAGEVSVCEPPRAREYVDWIVDRARRKYGKRIAPPAAQLLRDQIGDAVGLLDAELSKLAVFVGEAADIVPEAVMELTGRHREEKVFGVTDAMAAGDVAGALRQWEQVLATDRAAPARAIAGLAWGIRRLLEARREWEAGTDLAVLSRKLFTPPHVLRRRLESVSVASLERQQSDLLAADEAVKTGYATVESAVERFIVRHSPKRAGRAKPETVHG